MSVTNSKDGDGVKSLFDFLVLNEDEVVTGQLPGIFAFNGMDHEVIAQTGTSFSPLKGPFENPDQSPRLDERHQVLPLGEAHKSTPLERTAARVERSAWSRMSGWSKFFSVITIGFFYAIWSCFNPDIEEETVAPIVGHATSLKEPLVRPKIPNLTANKEEVDPIPFYFIVDAVQKRREAETVSLQDLNDSALGEAETLDRICRRLEVLAQGSGLSREDFMSAILSGTSYEDLGLKYYRFKQGTKEIPRGNKDEIIRYYSLAQASKASQDRKKIEIQNKREWIQADFSSSEVFRDMVKRGLPYSIYFGEEYFAQDVSFGNDSLFRNFTHTRAKLNTQLAQWATGKGSIQLTMSDPTFVAQHYLHQLSRPGIMTLSRAQELDLRQAHLDLVPRRGHRVYLESDGPTSVIRSERTVELQDSDKEVIKTYRYTELIRIKPGEAEDTPCQVKITKNVQEIE